MRVLWWMSCKTRNDKIGNETVRNNIWAAPIKDEITENCLKWFGNVYRRTKQTIKGSNRV